MIFEKKFVLVFVLVICFFCSTKTVYAEILINEVFANPSGDSSEKGEFIELFNNSDQEINISNYILEETKSYTIKNTSISPHGFVYFTREQTGLALNNSGDKIVLKDSGANIIDTFEFTQTIEDKSWSRFPDGIGTFYNNTNPTMGKENVPAPTPTSLPTNIPTPTVTLVPTATPFPTTTHGPIITEVQEENEKVDVLTDNTIISPSNNIKEENENDKSQTTKSDGYQFPILPLVFVSIGFSLIIIAIIYFYKTKSER